MPDTSIARLLIQPRRRLRKLPTKESLLHSAHVMGPTLTALMFVGASSAVAHAQGTMDFSGATTLMATFKTFAMYAGAVICLGVVSTFFRTFDLPWNLGRLLG
ncbi:MAG TPA: hypothetical protein VKX41_08860 [Alloacidobacterium sp.]|jgi:hypothetical protein|nr:hypothetical protein [Alloacidobacterium sp.]